MVGQHYPAIRAGLIAVLISGWGMAHKEIELTMDGLSQYLGAARELRRKR